MSKESLYKSVLLDHFHHPRNKGSLAGADAVRRGSNPRCGDEVEVGVYEKDGQLDQVRFRGRGCSVCIASASMMSQAVSGKATEEARRLCEAMQEWFGQGEGDRLQHVPEGLEALSSVRNYPARRRCVLLSWEALSEAIDAL
jgi:nitrogen fixation NifU-like protein